MPSIGTNAVEANTRIARIGNDAACAASALGTRSPIRAKIHEIANEKRSSSAIDAANGITPAWMRKPTRKPTTIIITTTKKLRTRSAKDRPASTADRAIGSERKRSIRPLCRSSLSPMPVFIAPKATVCTNTPGMRKSTYGMPGMLIEPPNT